MGAHELLALSMGLSVVVAALGWAGGRVVELLTTDPRVRDGVWAAALILPALPPLAVGLLLLTPAPVREIAAAPAALATELAIAPAGFVAAPPSADLAFDATGIAWALLGVALLLSLGRSAGLILRVRRLVRLLARTEMPGPAIREMVDDAANDLAIRPPLVLISATAPEALLASLGRVRLVLPAGLVAPSADPAATRAVIAHELSHLKRGDHRALWLEESLLALLAANPLMPVLHARRAAAREEACDALALAGATPETRRAYARSLIEALRSRAASQAPGLTPALTFTGAGRTTAMRRLRAALSPAPAASRRVRIAAVSLAAGLFGLTAGGSMVVAAQRPAQIVTAGEADGAPPGPADPAYLSAAMTPIFKAAWPGACGFGTDGPDQVFVHSGEGCPTLAGPRILIQSLEGISPSADPRGAFFAVKAACDANRPVRIAFSQGGQTGTKAVACAAAAVTPPDSVRFTVDLSYDPAIRIAAGDRLEIELKRNMEGGGTASSDIVLALAAGALPGQAFADLRPPLLPADLRTGPMFALSARIVGTDGAVKALSDRDLGRPFAPYLTSADAIVTRMRMLPADSAAQAAAERAARTAAEALPGEQALTVRISQSNQPLMLGSSSLLRVTLQSQDGERGARNITRMEMPIAPDRPLEREVRFPLKAEQLPTLTIGRVYDLTAEIRTAEGRVVYVADPVTVRMAPGSRGRLAGMRPELVLARAAAVPPPAVAPRAYQARLTIRDRGEVAATGRLGLVPGDGAVTVLNVDGREYRFDLSMEGPESDPRGEGSLTVRADVGRAAEAGGWEPVAKPVLLMRPDGTARMLWGSEAGLSYEIVVEPA